MYLRIIFWRYILTIISTFFKRLYFFVTLFVSLFIGHFNAEATEGDSLVNYSFSKAAQLKMRRPAMPRYTSVTTDTGTYQRFYGLKISGYARAFAQYRNLSTTYPNVPQHQLAINGYDATN